MGRKAWLYLELLNEQNARSVKCESGDTVGYVLQIGLQKMLGYFVTTIFVCLSWSVGLRRREKSILERGLTERVTHYLMECMYYNIQCLNKYDMSSNAHKHGIQSKNM